MSGSKDCSDYIYGSGQYLLQTGKSYLIIDSKYEQTQGTPPTGYASFYINSIVSLTICSDSGRIGGGGEISVWMALLTNVINCILLSVVCIVQTPDHQSKDLKDKKEAQKHSVFRPYLQWCSTKFDDIPTSRERRDVLCTKYFSKMRHREQAQTRYSLTRICTLW